MQNLRICFSKTDDAIYISHLDLMRCMQRAIQRANIPICFTEGFNPRPVMNFAMPLSIFIEGQREIMDIRIMDGLSHEDVKTRLQSAMPPGLNIISVTDQKRKASDVAFSKYKIEISQDKMPKETFNNAVLELIQRPELLAEKIGKQGKNKVVKYINLTEHIKDFKNWTSNDGNNVITLTLPSNTQFGVSPTLLTDKICEELKLEPEYIHITRKCLICEDGEELV
ncbi:MAG: TIGR03936 family radical SAM-associated protein [Oscillospiraceae bacterium]|nr:TIGR03936 family radical SAM-associated protein [Oscillospiraceae bacterium]